MPETVPEHVPSPRTPLVWDGTRYRAVRGHTDGTLQVRGEDQLFSYRDGLEARTSGIVSGANGYFDSAPATAGQIWVVTSVAAKDTTSPCTAIEMTIRVAANNFRFSNTMVALPANQWFTVQCHKWLDPTDRIRIYFRGSLAGDTCDIEITGHRITLET